MWLLTWCDIAVVERCEMHSRADPRIELTSVERRAAGECDQYLKYMKYLQKLYTSGGWRAPRVN